jgi:hypothetical protein
MLVRQAVILQHCMGLLVAVTDRHSPGFSTSTGT